MTTEPIDPDNGFRKSSPLIPLPTEPPVRKSSAKLEPRKFLARYWWLVPIAIAIALFAIRAVLHDEPLDKLRPAALDPKIDPSDAVAREGSLWIAHGGGPILVGFAAEPHDENDSFVRMVVGPQQRVVRGRGLVKEWMVVPPGPIAIRVVYHEKTDVRLVYSPVTRRGEDEYIPASSLSPDPPERATFSHPGTSILDGLVAAGLFATLIGTILMLARKRLAAVSRTTWIAMGVIFLGAMAVRLYDIDGFGQGWDEGINWGAGRNYITDLVGLDFSDAGWRWNYEHPPVMKLLEGIGAQFADSMNPARALSAVWVSLGCTLLVPIGTRLFRPRVGILAAAIAALLPPLIAHGQIVGHESPTVLWWSLAILLALGVHDYLHVDDRIAKRTILVRLAGVGVACGIAVSSRFVNGLVFLLVGAILLIEAPPKWRKWMAARAWLVIGLASLVTFYCVWPRLWWHPIEALQASFRKLDVEHANEPFLGAITNHPGAHYFLVYLYGTAPIGVLIGIAAFLWRVIGGDRKKSWRGMAIAGLWFAIPILAIVSPVRQDGVRYVMPSLTAMAMMAAAGADWVAVQLERWTKRAFLAIGCVMIAYLGFVVVRTHPYYLDYFGEQTGGAGVVASRGMFETAWWGEGIQEAIDYINEHAGPDDTVDRDCLGTIQHLGWFKYELWSKLVHDPKKATWLIHYKSMSCMPPADARIVYRVTHDGTTLATVYHRP